MTTPHRQALDRVHTDTAFLSRWGGLSREDVAYRNAYQGAVVDLLGGVWPHLAGRRVLDVGCGSGRWLRWFLEVGARPEDVTGVDVSDARFDEARAIHPGLRLEQTDGRRLPFEDGSFDLVTQFVCFMTMPDEATRRAVAAEMLRVLRPGGYVLWLDTPRSNTQLSDGKPMNPSAYFPGLAIRRLPVRPRPLPSQGLAWTPLRWTLGPVVDLLAVRPTHVAALLGPKP